VISRFTISPNTLPDEFRGRRPHSADHWPCAHGPGAPPPSHGRDGHLPRDGKPAAKAGQGYTQAQKIVGQSVGLPGVLPGTACEPKMTTVLSQDTTGR